MDRSKLLTVCGMTVFLAACGGDGGLASSGPPPSPPGVTYTKLADMTGDRTFQTAGVTYDPTAQGFANTSAQAFGSGAQVAYNAATDSYTLSAAGATTATFAPSNLVLPQPAPNTVQYLIRSNTNAPTDVLTLMVPRSANGVALSYTLIGTWATNLASGTPTYRIGIGGAPTQASDMPKTGSASYSVGVGGAANENGTSYDLGANSTGTFTANFGTSSVSTTLNLIGVQGANTPVSFGSFTGTGTISSTGPGFTGTFSGTAYNAFPVSGLLSGAFFGPQAAEMGYGYTLSAGGFSAVGAVAGAKQ